MQWFQNLAIGRKLAVAFTLTSLMTIALGVFALLQLRALNTQLQNVSGHDVPAMQYTGEIRAQLGEFRTFEMAQLTRLDEPDAILDYDKRMADSKAIVQAQQALYEALPLTADERTLYADVTEKLAAYFGAHDEIAAALAAGDPVAAQAVSDDKSRPMRRDLFASLKELGEQTTTKLHGDIAETDALYSTSSQAILAGIVALSVLAGLMGWFIARAIVVPVRDAVRVANDVSAGKLGGAIDTTRRDEVGQLLGAMQAMQTQVQSVITAQSDMAARHDAGEISYRMDDSRFPGEYGRMVRDTNTLVGAHIDIEMRMVDIMQRYAIGDLTVDMEALPGEQARLTEAMVTTKRNLLAINHEIRHLVDAAAGGDFTVRGDEAAFQHDFRLMVEGLNGLMGRPTPISRPRPRCCRASRAAT